MVTYKIKKGTHYAFHWFKIYLKKNVKMSHSIIFDDSCLYSFGDADDYDINKLFGRSFGMHHKDSFRFGWRADGNKIAIYAYNYINGKRVIDFLCKCSPSIKNNFSLIFESNTVKLNVNGVTWSYDLDMDLPFIGYKMYPYFGGNRTAPHDMLITFD